MAVVRLRATARVGRSHSEGTTVLDVLRALEGAHPAMAGWVLDERGFIREHVNVFVNGNEGAEGTAVGPNDRVHVLPSITGG